MGLGAMHPRELDFTLAIAFSVDDRGVLSRDLVTDAARAQQSLLYVAWLEPAKVALKIGISEKSLWRRWANVMRNMERPLEAMPFLRANEIRDREKLLSFSRGQRVEVWMIPYPAHAESRFSQFAHGFSLREAEHLLDSRYAPLFGRVLGERRPWGEIAPGEALRASTHDCKC